MADNVMLTTVDNPWDPFTNFEEWRVFDEQAGHHSLALLARVVVTSHDLSEVDEVLAYERGIDEICRENVSGLHRKAYPKSENKKSVTG